MPTESSPLPYAGFWRRLAAYLLDIVANGVLTGAVAPVVGLVYFWCVDAVLIREGHIQGSGAARTMAEGEVMLAAILILPLTAWLYRALFESSKLQATPGKLILGLKVTDLRDSRIGFVRATLRFLGRGLSLLPLGLSPAFWAFMALVNDNPFPWGGTAGGAGVTLTLTVGLMQLTARRQCLHDLLAETIVLRREVARA
jgi:uncharacterized RDD family membrane protein YckC